MSIRDVFQPVDDFRFQVVRGGDALVGVWRQRLDAEQGEAFGNAAPQVRREGRGGQGFRGWGHGLQRLGNDFLLGFTGIEMPQRENAKKNRAQSVDVGPLVELAAVRGLFGRETAGDW